MDAIANMTPVQQCGMQAFGMLFIAAPINAGIGYGLGSALGIINPLHGAVYLVVDTLVGTVVRPVGFYGIDMMCRGEDLACCNGMAKLAIWAASFFISAVISVGVMSLGGVAIAFGTAFTLSALCIVVSLVALVAIALLCCPYAVSLSCLLIGD